MKNINNDKLITITLLNSVDDNLRTKIILDPDELIVGGTDTQDIYEIISRVLVINGIDFITTVEE